jgi:Family of unknown function (DUF6328)
MGENRTPGETEPQRLNRELDQLLQELRVAMPGVQVLFAFLFAVPFQQRFATVTAAQKSIYFATLLIFIGLWFVLAIGGLIAARRRQR